MVMPAAIGAMGSIIGAGIGASSAKQVNDENVYLANTRYQRTTADMRKAGINPMMAVQSGSSAGSVPQLTNPADSASKTAGALVKGVVDTANSAANVNMKKQLGEKAVADTANAVKTGELIDAQRAKTIADTQVSLNNAKNLDADYNRKKLVGDLYHEAGNVVDYGIKRVHDFFGGDKSNSVGAVNNKVGSVHSAKSSPKHFADERPHIWEPDYKERMKEYKKYVAYMKSINPNFKEN